MKLQKALFVEKLNDFERKICPVTVETKAMDAPEVLHELCNVAIVDFSESLNEIFVEPLSSHCKKIV